MTHIYHHVTQLVTPQEAVAIVRARGELSHDMRRLISQPFNSRLAEEVRGEISPYMGEQLDMARLYLSAYRAGEFGEQMKFCSTYWPEILAMFPGKTVPREPFKNRPLYFIAAFQACFPRAEGAPVYMHLLKYKLPRNLFREATDRSEKAA